jgi:hypothetical protein
LQHKRGITFASVPLQSTNQGTCAQGKNRLVNIPVKPDQVYARATNRSIAPLREVHNAEMDLEINR